MKKNASIKWSIFLYLISFCIMLLGVLWIFQIIFLENFYKSIKSMEIRRDASAIGSYVTQSLWSQLSEAVSGRDDLYVEVWAVDSGSVIVTGNYRDGIQAKMSQSDKITLFLQLREQGTSIVNRYFTEASTFPFRTSASESIMYSDILVGEDGQTWMLMVSANITPVQATVNTLRYQIYVITGIMVWLSVFVALLISRRITRPIESLNTAAGELGRGNYDVVFRGDDYSEIGQLAATLTHAARELSKTEELRQELVANVSHDLRTPLTLITGYGEMIRDIPGENTPENMQVIIDESKRLSSLVTDLLDLSKLQAGTMEVNLQEIPLTCLTRQIIDRFARFTEQDDYRILFESSEEVSVLADQNRLSQVLYNLIINAMTYTGADKTVRVRQTVANGTVKMEIIDSGDGIAPENLPYVWDRYYKVDKVHKRAVTGTGLGLSIVKTILTQHPEVRFGVESQPGSGSDFWFILPVLPPTTGSGPTALDVVQ